MKPQWAQITIGAILIVFLLVFLGWFFYTFAQADVEFQSGILALIGVVAAGIIAAMSAKKREREARHFDEKRKGYTEFVNMMMKYILAEKLKKDRPSVDQLAESMVEFKKLLVIWADAEVIKMWNQLEMELAGSQQDPILVTAKFDDFHFHFSHGINTRMVTPQPIQYIIIIHQYGSRILTQQEPQSMYNYTTAFSEIKSHSYFWFVRP